MQKRVTSSKALPSSVVNIQLVLTPYQVGTGTILLLQSTFIFTTVEIPIVATCVVIAIRATGLIVCNSFWCSNILSRLINKFLIFNYAVRPVH